MLDNNQVKFTVDTLISTLGIDTHVPISYGFQQEKKGIIIYRSGEKERVSGSIGRVNLSSPPDYTLLEDKSPVLFDHVYLNIGDPLLKYESGEVAVAYVARDDAIYIGFDILASAFYFLSLEEEANTSKFDEHRRYQAKFGPLSSKFATMPVVNNYLRILFKAILYLHEKTNRPLVQKWYWPNGKEFAVCLTHDIDFFRPGALYQFLLPFKCLFRFDFKKAGKAFKRYFSIIGGKTVNPWDYNKIAKLENELGVKSTFFLMAGGQAKHDYPYDLKKLKGELERLRNEKSEFGLHGSYNSYQDLKILSEEKKKLEDIIKDVHGCRQHYLRFDKDTWVKQEKAAFAYDSTLYFADTFGFRGGIAHPFHPYNHHTGKMMNILEIPLTLMDKTLIDYLHLNSDQAQSVIEEHISIVEKSNGLATLLWHNELFDDLGFPGWGELYKKVLTDIKDRNAWVTSSENIHNWWVGRSNLFLEKSLENENSLEIVYRANGDIENMTFFVYCLKGRKCKVKCKGTSSISKTEVLSINIDRIENGEIIRLEMGT